MWYLWGWDSHIQCLLSCVSSQSAGSMVVDRWVEELQLTSGQERLQVGENCIYRYEKCQVVVHDWTVSCVRYLLGKNAEYTGWTVACWYWDVLYFKMLYQNCQRKNRLHTVIKPIWLKYSMLWYVVPLWCWLRSISSHVTLDMFGGDVDSICDYKHPTYSRAQSCVMM